MPRFRYMQVQGSEGMLGGLEKCLCHSAHCMWTNLCVSVNLVPPLEPNMIIM